MNLWISGQKRMAADLLPILLSTGHTVAGVSVNGEDEFSRAAESAGLPVRPWGMLDPFPDGVDLLVCAHSWEYIPASIRARCRYGAIGYHPSLLPLYRGRNSVVDALSAGQRVTGGTVYALTDEMDAGPIYAQDWCFIAPQDDARALWRRELQPMGIRLLAAVIDAIPNIQALPQAEAGFASEWPIFASLTS